MLQSETYELLDCLKYDKGTTSDHNDIWNTNDTTLSRQSEYSNVSESTAGTDGNISTKIDHSVCLEFDVQLISDAYNLSFGQIGQSQNATTRREIYLLVQDSGWHPMRIEIQNGVATVSSTETSTTQTLTLTNYDSSMDMYWRFRTNSNITEINFKNFKCYPI